MSDALRDDVQVLSPDGRHLLTFGRPGSGRGQLDFQGDAVVFGDRVYVADHANRRLSEEGGASDIWVMGVKGGEPQQVSDLAAGGGRGLQPSRTPDGSRLILVAETMIGSPRGAFLEAESGSIDPVPRDLGMTHPRLRPLP